MIILKTILRIILGIILAVAGLFEGIDLGTNGWLTKQLTSDDIKEENEDECDE